MNLQTEKANIKKYAKVRKY